MAQTKIIGGGTLQPPVELAVDATFLAARVALRPLDYINQGRVKGHYATAQVSGAVTVMGAGGIFASIRWADPNSYLVLMRVRAAWSVISAITVATIMDASATIVRGFSVDNVTASTALSMAAVTNTNKMRASMGTSLMGISGPRICTTVTESGGTFVADAAPFGYAVWQSLQNTNSAGTAVLLSAGASGAMQDLYNWQNMGQHPVVLSNQEGVNLRAVTAALGSGSLQYYAQWEWAEVEVF